ncbi:hypothetical protein HanIR_Chr10g0493101 [Helianthus annuus]|nr:hypothetical protein HanIR_Chr10g0493101 [Helianthus annuus]KAJ0531183.1 hypothetical protein HanHA89_Chr10g0398341 [Helianthus annuus]
MIQVIFLKIEDPVANLKTDVYLFRIEDPSFSAYAGFEDLSLRRVLQELGLGILNKRPTIILIRVEVAELEKQLKMEIKSRNRAEKIWWNIDPF